MIIAAATILPPPTQPTRASALAFDILFGTILRKLHDAQRFTANRQSIKNGFVFVALLFLQPRNLITLTSPPTKDIGSKMNEAKPSTMDQLRRLIGSDGSSNKMAPERPAPAASPLGTDDEAGGTTPTAERIEMARKAEENMKAAAKRRS